MVFFCCWFVCWFAVFWVFFSALWAKLIDPEIDGQTYYMCRQANNIQTTRLKEMQYRKSTINMSKIFSALFLLLGDTRITLTVPKQFKLTVRKRWIMTQVNNLLTIRNTFFTIQLLSWKCLILFTGSTGRFLLLFTAQKPFLIIFSFVVGLKYMEKTNSIDSQNHRIIESQNNLSLKESINIIESNSWFHTEAPKDLTMYLTALSRCFLNSGSSGLCPPTTPRWRIFSCQPSWTYQFPLIQTLDVEHFHPLPLWAACCTTSQTCQWKNFPWHLI